MEILLNEKSLDGQFDSLEAFLKTLPEMSRNMKILKERNLILYKHSSLYARTVTNELSLMDLQNSKGNILPEYRDVLRKWKRDLSMLTTSPPFWDTESQKCEDSISEAARRNTDVISFQHPDYEDKELKVVDSDNNTHIVYSSVTTNHLLTILLMRKVIDFLYFLRTRYTGKRLVLEQLDMESVKKLQKSELVELTQALDRFESMDSWRDICTDTFFYYKSYQPVSKKKNYFANMGFGEKDIDKFRCGQHSQVRCFGYREGEKFHILMVERDHSVSDTG